MEREAVVGPRAFAHKSKQTLVFDPKRSIGLTMTGEGMDGRASRSPSLPMGKNGTRVEVSWKLEVKNVPGFVQGIVKGQISKATEDALKKFKNEAERVPPTNGGKARLLSGNLNWPPNYGSAAGDSKLAGALLTFAGLGFLMLITVLESIYPNYSVHTNTISDLLAIGTRTSLIGEPLAFIAAVSWIGGAYYLFRKSGRRRLMALNLLPGTGLLLAVLSPENVNIAIHSLGAVIAFIPGPIAAILSYTMIKSHYRYFALSLGSLSLFGAVMEFGAYETAFFQQTLGPGGWERVIVYPLLIWLIGFGGLLLVESGEGSR